MPTSFGLPLDEAVTLFGTLPDADESSRYYQVFLNKAALGTLDPNFLPAYVAANEQKEIAVPGSGDKLSAYHATLALCLALKPDEVTALIGLLDPAVTTLANKLKDLLSFASIAGVYSLALLARRLGLSVSDLVTLQSLTGSAVLEGPAELLLFIQQSRQGAGRRHQAGRPALPAAARGPRPGQPRDQGYLCNRPAADHPERPAGRLYHQ